MINAPKYIISEFYKFSTNTKLLVKEAEDRGKPIIMSGILQKADTLNRNGRVYPFEILKREVDKYMESVENGTAGGECDHPDSSVVSLANVSHRVIDMWWEGKELYGKILIAEETAAGKTLKGLLKAGFTLGISSRGVGSVKRKGNADYVQEDFELVAFDFVSTPSTPGAYLFQEGKEVFKRGMIPLEVQNGIYVKKNEIILENIEENKEYFNTLNEIKNNIFWKNI